SPATCRWGKVCHRGTNCLTEKRVGPTSSLGIIAGDCIPDEYSPATIPQRHVAGENPEMSLGKTPIVVVLVSLHIKSSSRGFTVRQAALKAASCKVTKHEKACIENQHVFIPFAFDTFGFLAPETVELLTRVQRVINSNVMTPRSTNVVFNRIVRGGSESSQLSLLQEYIEGTILSSLEDRWVWDLNGEGVFCVKDVRNLLGDVFLPKAPIATRWIKYVSIKLNVFAWKVHLNRLPTRVNLQHRGVLVSDPSCPIYHSEDEDLAHLFFLCSLVTDIVKLVCRWWNIAWASIDSYSNWLHWFNAIRLSPKVKDLLEGVFYITWSKLCWRECSSYLGGLSGTLGIGSFLKNLLQDVRKFLML
ncbi:RNA-directed DNA polymerase, eukaryota, partial [Tanacetum coccineum]